jgi:hypothetical protein
MSSPILLLESAVINTLHSTNEICRLCSSSYNLWALCKIVPLLDAASFHVNLCLAVVNVTLPSLFIQRRTVTLYESVLYLTTL